VLVEVLAEVLASYNELPPCGLLRGSKLGDGCSFDQRA
jgi:hypothetical protein